MSTPWPPSNPSWSWLLSVSNSCYIYISVIGMLTFLVTCKQARNEIQGNCTCTKIQLFGLDIKNVSIFPLEPECKYCGQTTCHSFCFHHYMHCFSSTGFSFFSSTCFSGHTFCLSRSTTMMMMMTSTVIAVTITRIAITIPACDGSELYNSWTQTLFFYLYSQASRGSYWEQNWC